ncbi:hypothetical protein WISP_79793 [Willisornis vidua]|uniref:Envelope glycoprotein n=1 Tax=Willisornis vidua TaxID=1566151 RepID=A0ABQ9D5E4_9PASS|nr:hypothetical protein WISP_79793 [Willisornis vidua]
MPQAAGDPIPWGIIPITQMPLTVKNVSWECQMTPEKVTVRIDVCRVGWPINKEECKKRTDYYKWIDDSPLPELKRKCLVYLSKPHPSWGSRPEPCYKFQLVESQSRPKLKCSNVTNSLDTWGEWNSAWGFSLLEHYSYLGKVQWCIQWKGEKNQTHDRARITETSSRNPRDQIDNWNCTEVFTCDTPQDRIGLVPVKVALRWGCECRGYQHTITSKYGEGVIDCKRSTLPSPGNLVWVLGHGQWTTHLSLDGPVTQITLGIPTLCPFWKPSKLTATEIQPRQRRDIDRDIDDIGLDKDDWQEPSGGVKFGWALESLFAQVASYRNREMLYKLMGQTERLAAVTKKGFKDLNIQLQATSRMTLQNRMALDMILLKEHGVCGYLHGRDEHCCVHIPNVTQEVENDISQLEQIEKKVDETRKEAEHNWVGEIFSSLGIQVSGWLSSIVQYGIMIIIIIIVALVMYKCLLGMIMRESQHTRKVIKAMTRKENPGYEMHNHLPSCSEATV